MAAPTVYMSTDAEAPALTGVLGSLIALLDAVLVTGYGSKSPLGWTKDFSGENKAVYRPGAGNDRMFYRISDTAGGGRFAYLSMYEAMSDVDNGSGKVTSVLGDEGASGASTIAKSASADTNPRQWVIIGDAYGFWFFVIDGYSQFGRTTHTLPHYIGQPIDPLGIGNSAMFLCSNYSSSTLVVADIGLGTSSTETATRIHRYIDASVIGVNLYFGIGCSIPIKTSTPPVNPYPYNGQAILSGDVFMYSSDNSMIPRVKMPGLKVGAHSSIGLTPFEMLPDTTLLTVHPAIARVSYGGTETQYKRFWAIDIGEGYRA